MVKIESFGKRIEISAWHVDPEKRININGYIALYKKRAYVANNTNRYWFTPGRGNVVELRNIYGRKLKSVGSREIEKFYPEHFDKQDVPKEVKKLYENLLRK